MEERLIRRENGINTENSPTTNDEQIDWLAWLETPNPNPNHQRYSHNLCLQPELFVVSVVDSRFAVAFLRVPNLLINTSMRRDSQPEPRVSIPKWGRGW